MRSRRILPPVLLVWGAVLLGLAAGCRKPPTVAESVALANAKLDGGQVTLAIQELQALDQAHPGTPAVLEALAFAYAQDQRPRESGETFLRRARLNFEGADYFLYAGSALAQAGLRSAAADAYREYLRARPEDGPAWATLGRLLDDSNDPPAAIEAFLRSWEAFPDPAIAQRLGDLFLRLRNAAQAETWFQRAREAGGELAAPALVGLLETALLARSPAAAERWLLMLDRDHPRYLDQSTSAARRAEIQAWRQAQDEAAAAIARQREELQRRQEQEAAERQAAAEEAARLAAEALAAAEAAEADANPPPTEAGAPAPTARGNEGSATGPAVPTVPPVPATARFAQADALTAQGDLDGAFGILQDALGDHPDDARLWAALAENALTRADLRWAEAAALEARRLDPSLPAVRRAWVRTAAVTLPPARYLNELASLRESFPDDADLTLALARTLREQRGPRPVIAQFYREFLRLAPRHPERAAAEAELASL